MRINTAGYFRDITPDDLLALQDSTPEPTSGKWHFRVATVAEYKTLARALTNGQAEIIEGDRVQLWAPVGVGRRIRKLVAQVRAERATNELLEGINAS